MTPPWSGFHIDVHAGTGPEFVTLLNPTSSHLALPRGRKTNMSLHQCHVLQEDRYLYGMKGMAVYASGHPSDPSCLANPLMSTWTPIKNLFAIGASDLDAKFTAFYETIHDNIVSCILATLPDGDWGLNVLRLGFDTTPVNPITIHLVVAPNGALSEDMAVRLWRISLPLLPQLPL